MANGVIKKLITDRGFGFIQPAEGSDIFFHSSEVQGVGYDALREGQAVEFDMSKGRDGRSQAVGVRLAEAEVKEELPSTEETTEAAETVEEDSTEETTEAAETVEEDPTETS